MKCPYCGHEEQKVLDSRPARESTSIRRRRECDSCGRRFTTFEEPEKPRLYVIKSDGGRQLFDREKLLSSMLLACGKRPVPVERLEQSVAHIERDLLDQFELEVQSSDIGERAMEELYHIDTIGYIRYSSVYRAFDCPEQFAEIVKKMQRDSRAKSKATVSSR
ncbi:MAG: transcriptional regulator NrdR [Fimbriimonadaceae bacterium]|nr:MAG: transcriptional regulator NrdR [Fimbriimonadaceae bacterium]